MSSSTLALDLMRVPKGTFEKARSINYRSSKCQTQSLDSVGMSKNCFFCAGTDLRNTEIVPYFAVALSTRSLFLKYCHQQRFQLPRESLFLDILVIKRMIEFCKAVFPSVGYAYNIIPTYTSGHLGYVIASKTKEIDWLPGGTIRKSSAMGANSVHRNLNFAQNIQIWNPYSTVPTGALAI
ncbi:hypothetical protein ACTXT7_003936 [Hymenolepis weldensis]